MMKVTIVCVLLIFHSYAQNYFNDKKSIIGDSTIIDPQTLDTSDYNRKYSLFKIIDAWNPGFDGKLEVGDFDQDEKSEVYSSEYTPFIYFTPAKIWEIDEQYNFNLEYTYSDSQTWILDKYDIDNDGDDEIILNTFASRGIKVYTKPNLFSLPTELLFEFSYGEEYQIDNNVFCDADKDGKTDYIFTVPGDTMFVEIYEYDKNINNFTQKYFSSPQYATVGFTLYDWDQDGKNEILYSGGYGGFGLLECTGDDQYENVYEDDTELFSAYNSFATNDIDENGLSEFWIGGADFANDAYKIIGFEAVGDNNYKRVTSITIFDLRAYPYGHMQKIDFNGDGKDELFVALNEYIFILTFNGTPNHYSFDVAYFGIVKPEFTLTWIDNVTVAGIFNEKANDIFVSLTENQGNDYYHRTYIYKNTIVNNVELQSESTKYFLNQNYPNPFNPSTNIKFRIADFGFVTLKVYDVLGNEIATLVNEEKPAGEYEVIFDASSGIRNLPAGRQGLVSGIYFYQLKFGDYIQTKKMVYLK